ncbi:type I restriction-modification system subunit M/S [Amycolatopsis pigmentata]|uniref:site-specific DNA-methyltransferase (adenine-specific) n=1 Tax=Amycolatopsis pigmentata TaxID=450801 RepID=A0ABW5G114_9PSEU
MVSGQELFDADEIARWLGRRKIASNNLKPGETPGTVYSDRFIRNRGVLTPGTQAEPRIQTTARPDRTSELWRSVDLLRGDFDFMTAVDFLMAMLYLRSTDQELWREIAQQESGHVVGQMLRRVRLPDNDVPLFPNDTSALSSKQMLETIKLLEGMDLEEEELAAAFDTLLERAHRDLGKHGGHFTPRSLVRCMMDIIDPQSADGVHDPSCGSGEFLTAAAQHGVKSLGGQAMNTASLRMTLLNLAVHGGKADLRIGGPEITRGAFGGERFDVILSNPPFSIKLPNNVEEDAWPFGTPPQRIGDFAWLQLAVHKLKPGGRAGVLMPSGTLFRSGREAEIRSSMVEAGVVEGIVALPAGLFASTGIPVSLWVLRTPKHGKADPSEVLFIDATRMGASTRNSQRILRRDEAVRIVHEYRNWREFGSSEEFGQSLGFARPVPIEEIRRNDYNLQPQRYVGEEADLQGSRTDTPSAKSGSVQRTLDKLAERAKRTRAEIDAHLAILHRSAPREWRTVSLGEICDIQAGPGTVNRERGTTVPGWTPLVLPRNIKRGHLSHEELDTVKPETFEKLSNYLLRSGDIVCARSGTLGRHGLVREPEDGWALGPSCMRIRPTRAEVVPEYLVHYLNSAEVNEWIMAQSRGSTAIPHISAVTLRMLVIALPSVATQREIAATMDSIDLHIEQHQRAISATQSLRDLVFPSLSQP